MKTRILSILLLALFLACPQVFAASVNNEATPGAGLTVDGGVLTFNFSPQVAGMYNTEGTTGNEQWYAVATYHPGGSQFFASTSEASAIYKQARETVQTFGDVVVPQTPLAILQEAGTDPDTGEEIPAVTQTADQAFLDEGWNK